MEKRPKIIGIGLNKTATSSLEMAMVQLGFKVLHDGWVATEAIRRERRGGLPILSTLEEYDAFMDVPFDRVWRELDAEYPGSKFILTTRDMPSWIKSRSKHVKANRTSPSYRGLWLLTQTSKWEEEWRRHHDGIREYFQDRPDDLLIMDICAGDGWEKLCPFLGVDAPEGPFPQANVTTKKTERRMSLLTPFVVLFQLMRYAYHAMRGRTREQL
jgi:hypothetical protein